MDERLKRHNDPHTVPVDPSDDLQLTIRRLSDGRYIVISDEKSGAEELYEAMEHAKYIISVQESTEANNE